MYLSSRACAPELSGAAWALYPAVAPGWDLIVLRNKASTWVLVDKGQEAGLKHQQASPMWERAMGESRPDPCSFALCCCPRHGVDTAGWRWQFSEDMGSGKGIRALRLGDAMSQEGSAADRYPSKGNS